MKAVMAMYEQARTVVRCSSGVTDPFQVRVGLHQGSVLSPLLFVVVLEEVTRGVRVGAPWEMLYADDLVLTGESDSEV